MTLTLGNYTYWYWLKPRRILIMEKWLIKISRVFRVPCCCCCCCLRSVTALFPRGRLPKEDLRRSPLPPRPLVTPGPCCSSCSLSPHTYCHASCIRSVPLPSSCPIQISYQVSGLPPPCLPVLHIYLKPHTYEPLKNPTYKLCYLLISTALSKV